MLRTSAVEKASSIPISVDSQASEKGHDRIQLFGGAAWGGVTGHCRRTEQGYSTQQVSFRGFLRGGDQWCQRNIRDGKEVCRGSFPSLFSPFILISSSLCCQRCSVAYTVHLSQGLCLPMCQLTEMALYSWGSLKY